MQDAVKSITNSKSFKNSLHNNEKLFVTTSLCPLTRGSLYIQYAISKHVIYIMLTG